MSDASSSARGVGRIPAPLGTKSLSPSICRSRLKAWLTAEGVIESARAAFVTLLCCMIASNTQNKLRSILRIWMVFSDDLVVSLDFLESYFIVCKIRRFESYKLGP